MKAIHTISMIAVFAAATALVSAQDYPDEYLGLPGDNLNLYAVMDLFQESETLEKFERSLNDKDATINNLDLNGDNLIDYITVSDYVDEDVHTIVLRTSLNRNEQQDIAVFVVEQLRNGQVQIQLIGDEALYGPNYIVEPIYAETPNPGYTGNRVRSNVNVVTTSYYDIAAWPVIRYIYRPGYVVWRSSWYWGYYPTYWSPWRPHYWHYYYGYHSHWNDHYYRHYRHYDHYRCRSYNTFYHSHVRVHSPTVVVNINNGRYRSTYSRPDQRLEGERYYASTAGNRTNTSRTAVSKVRNDSRTGTVSSREGVKRTSSPSNVSRTGVSTSKSRENAVRATPGQRTTATTSRTNQSSVQRSNSNNRNAAVQRSSQGRSSNSAVSRSSSTRNSAPAVQRSNSQSRSSSSVSRSSSSPGKQTVTRSSSSPSKQSVSRSSSPSKQTVSRSSSSRSQPSVSRSSSSPSKQSVSRSSSPSKQSVSRSSSPSKQSVSRSSSSRSQPSVSRSSSSPSKQSVSRSSSSRSKGSSVQRSQPSRSKSSPSGSGSSNRNSSRSSSSSRR